MTIILSVDLASKFSAYCVLEDTGEVHDEGDSRDMSPFQFADLLHAVASNYVVDLTLFEDLPYGISGQGQTKAVTRLQGILMYAFRADLYDVLFVNPSTWQRSYPGVARGEKTAREEAARKAAEELGYKPPPLVDEWTLLMTEAGKRVLKKDTNPLAKVQTDYIDAFLMGHWAHQQEGIRSLSGVQSPMI